MRGKVGQVDATFSLLDDDMIAMAAGKLNPSSAFTNVSYKKR